MIRPLILRRIGALAAVAAFGVGAAVGSGAAPAGAAPSYYIAMGDSYSSGEGAPPYDAGTATRADMCHRSTQAWPRLLAAKAGLKLSAFMACSGAVADNITVTPQRAIAPDNKTQVQQLRNDLRRGPAPSLVTLTIGGNDIQFANILTNCFTTDCVKSSVLADANTIVNGSTFAATMKSTYQAVRSTLPATTRLVVVGYPNIFNPNSNNANLHCRWLSAAEDRGLVALAGSLDSKLSRIAAQVPGVEYDSTLGALKNHELCTGKSYVNSLTLAGGFLGHQELGHPTVEGQRLLADDVSSYLRKTPVHVPPRTPPPPSAPTVTPAGGPLGTLFSVSTATPCPTGSDSVTAEWYDPKGADRGGFGLTLGYYGAAPYVMTGGFQPGDSPAGSVLEPGIWTVSLRCTASGRVTLEWPAVRVDMTAPYTMSTSWTSNSVLSVVPQEGCPAASQVFVFVDDDAWQEVARTNFSVAAGELWHADVPLPAAGGPYHVSAQCQYTPGPQGLDYAALSVQ